MWGENNTMKIIVNIPNLTRLLYLSHDRRLDNIVISGTIINIIEETFVATANPETKANHTTASVVRRSNISIDK